MPALTVKTLHVGMISPEPTWRMAAHTHDFHELITILRGRMHVAGPGLDDDCAEGDVLLYPARTAHEERADPCDPVETVFFGFSSRAVSGGELRRMRDLRGRVRELAVWLFEDRLPADAAGAGVRDAIAAAMLAEFLAEPGRSTDPMVEETRRWVLEHVAEEIRLDDLAELAGISRYHFIRRYKSATGRTPMQDVRSIRVDHARSLLLSTSLTLKEIAPRAGLGDEYSLSRVFRRVLGSSPRSLRRFHKARS